MSGTVSVKLAEKVPATFMLSLYAFEGAGTSIVASLANVGTATGTLGLTAGELVGGGATATAIANGTATQIVLTNAGGVTTTILASGEIIVTKAGTILLHLLP